MPASRRIRATTFTPRSCPSSPALPTSTRIRRPSVFAPACSGIMAPSMRSFRRGDGYVKTSRGAPGPAEGPRYDEFRTVKRPSLLPAHAELISDPKDETTLEVNFEQVFARADRTHALVGAGVDH